MKHIFLVALVAMTMWATVACSSDVQPASPDTTPAEEVSTDNIYQFSVRDGQGNMVSLDQYRGQVLLVINTATECGYTPQYEDIERMYEAYRAQGFMVLDFPCNQFNGQTPGDYDDIHDFCVNKYSITFPQFDKIDVNGANADPLYVWLKEKKPGNIQWNFTKFLLNRKGEVVSRWEPNSDMVKMEQAILEQL